MNVDKQWLDAGLSQNSSDLSRASTGGRPKSLLAARSNSKGLRRTSLKYSGERTDSGLALGFQGVPVAGKSSLLAKLASDLPAGDAAGRSQSGSILMNSACPNKN